MAGREWSTDEDRRLLELHDAGQLPSQIALVLSLRTPEAIRLRLKRLKQMGVPVAEWTVKWTPDLDKELLRLACMSTSNSAVAEQLGLNEAQVRSHLSQLRQRGVEFTRPSRGVPTEMVQDVHARFQRERLSIKGAGALLGLSQKRTRELFDEHGLERPESTTWTAKEERQLFAMLEAGMLNSQIALALNRSPEAIRMHMNRLRLKGMNVPQRRRHSPRWTAGEDERLIRMVRHGRLRPEIAKALSRDELAITQRLARLRKNGISLPPIRRSI